MADAGERTAKQTYGADKQPNKCQLSQPVHLACPERFSEPVAVAEGSLQPFLNGKDYFADMIKEIEGASISVCMTGWQINWDAQLDANGTRLFDVIKKKAESSSVQFYLMPWDNPQKPGLARVVPQTYSGRTRDVFERLNKKLKEKSGKDSIYVYCSPGEADTNSVIFSNHQKTVIIDNTIAYIGGIDIAYGRYDDNEFCLFAGGDKRNGLNRYNGCVAKIGKFDERGYAVVDPDLLTGAYDRTFGNADTEWKKITEQKGLQQNIEAENGNDTLDPDLQPRMPWQDLQHRVSDPSVVHNILVNFALRWNIGADVKLQPRTFIKTEPVPGNGMTVQVLRTASQALRHSEWKKSQGLYFTAEMPEPTKPQDNIYKTMLQLIEAADHYIYIENQFFSTCFGASNPARGSALSSKAEEAKAGTGWRASALKKIGGAWTGFSASWYPSLGNYDELDNYIGLALGQRIFEAINDALDTPFHVYIVLPVHPEGPLNATNTMNQVHVTMQSLVFGEYSLVKLIEEGIRAAGKSGKKHWTDYLTLLNLRNWGVVQGVPVTEQVYVHTKLMIVDDRFIVHGSANINDRSLMGAQGDSEIAILIDDSQCDKLQVDICDNGCPYIVSPYVSKLRKDIWSKLFGLSSEGCSPYEGAGPAMALEGMLDKPAAKETYSKIQEIAAENLKIYAEVFPWIPQNQQPGRVSKPLFPLQSTPANMSTVSTAFEEVRSEMPGPASIWPKPAKDMPFSPKFRYSEQLGIPAKDALPLLRQNIKGFIVALPVDWTKGENNDLGWHLKVIG